MQPRQIIGRIGIVLAGMLFLGGCLSINAPKKVTVDVNGKSKTKKVDKRTAYDRAERVAHEHGQNADQFNRHDQKADDGWWILFDHKINGYKLGWPYHFAVRVTFDGKATLYKSVEE